MTEEVDQLTAESLGVWEVETQGSTHTWDIRKGDVFYSRHAGEQSKAGPFAHDDVTHRLTRVDRWPAVGGQTVVFYDDPDDPFFMEQWRVCSTIKSIRRVA